MDEKIEAGHPGAETLLCIGRSLADKDCLAIDKRKRGLESGPWCDTFAG